MSEILAIILIWKVTSRPLIWPPFESYFIYLKWRYGIFNIFLIFGNFACHQRFLPNHWTKFNLAMLIFFCFLMRITRLKKNFSTFAILGLFGPFFRFSFFFNFRFFLFFKYLLMSQILSIIFIWKKRSGP